MRFQSRSFHFLTNRMFPIELDKIEPFRLFRRIWKAELRLYDEMKITDYNAEEYFRG